MKALVLSGGSGVRLRPLTYSMPKQLIPVANRPVLEHVIRGIRDLGVTEVGVVVGGWVAAIRAAIGDGAGLGVRVTYLPQERPLGLAHAVRLARPYLGDDDFVMYLGDNLLPDGVVEPAGDFRRHRPAAQLLLHKVSDPSAYGVAEVNPDGSLRGLVEKPARPRSDLAVVGVYFFTRAIHDAVDAIGPSARGELEITDAIQWLLTRGDEVAVREHSGFWSDVGTPQDVLTCNRRLLGDLRARVDGQVDRDSVLRGRVVVECGARVLRSRIDGPAIIGAGTLVEDSRIGPGTALGSDCVLRATDIADSVVLDGAGIRGVGGLRGCLIGRSASIAPGGRQQPGTRLVVGDHARIALAGA
jgi:glucose-1-phosphate thymidylyltransferase